MSGFVRRLDREWPGLDWTLTLRDNAGHWRRLTIEVRPALRQIAQARGRFNRLPEPRDILALEAWATRNKLQVSLGRW